MAAPMTELLFVFLLGIASWSRYVAANTVTLVDCDVDVTDGNDIIQSWECEVGDNKLQAKIVTSKCPGVAQLDIVVSKDGTIESNVQQSITDGREQLGGLCNKVDGPESDDDSCSMPEGEYNFANCDISSFFTDMELGEHNVKIGINLVGDTAAIVNMNVNVEGE